MMSIRTKLIIWILVLFIFIGGLIYVPLSKMLPQKITAHILKRDIRIAEYIAADAKEYLLLNDTLAISLLLHENLNKLEDARYLFIADPAGRIVSHTFKGGFPRALMPLNNPGARHSYAVRELLSDGKRVYCISVPVLKGELGSLHLGVSLESSKAEIAEFAKINHYVALVIFVGLGIGIFIFSLLGVFLSNRIINLKNFADRVGAGELDKRIEIRSDDELGSLAVSFNGMVASLNEKMDRIKELTHLEERGRIAIEFHDGIAQDLVNVIKRLELCEKLFKVDQESAYKELYNLRENARGVLNKTRQVIFDLKSPEEAEFSLESGLADYIKNYRTLTGIKVGLNVSGPIDGIAPHVARQVFHVIKEAFVNVQKHSLAQHVEVSLRRGNGALSVDIIDDGKGFDPNETGSQASGPGKWGLDTMRRRTDSINGALAIESKPNAGTRISINIPVVEERNQEV